MELRSLAAEAQRVPAPAPASAPGQPPRAAHDPRLQRVLKASIGQVNSLQQSSSALASAFEQGAPGVDISRVMVEAQKATLAFRAMNEVRNRLVSAYQDVMNMPI